MRIDAHQHFWHYNREEYGWIGPELAALARDFLPPDLEPLLKETGMDGSIAVQARQTVEETRWLLTLADEFSFIKGVVGWVDLRSPDLAEQLGQFAPARKLRGVRHFVQDEPDIEFMLRPDFLRGIGLLAAFNLAYDILVYSRQLPAAIKLVERFPRQRFVLDHIAKPPMKQGAMSPWKEHIGTLAEHANVYCKVSGMVTEVEFNARPPMVDFRPYLDVVFDAFGPGRLMIGSDWPVCTAAGSYASVLGIVFDYVSQFSPAEQAAVLGDNAARFYQLGEL